MFKYLLKGLLGLSVVFGLLQFFIIPGIVWNILLPFIFISVITIAIKNRNGFSDNFTKRCTLLLGMILLCELIFCIQSRFNISDPVEKKELSVMTYNLFFKNRSPQKVITLIKEMKPDVIFVQELTPEWASYISGKLGEIYVHQVVQPLRGTHGIGIYSKCKIENQYYLKNKNNKPFAQIADLVFHNKRIQVINTHLASPAVAVENKENFISLYHENYRVRKEQLRRIGLETVDNSEKYSCQLLIGDLNTMKYEPIFKSLKLTWVNGYSISSNGLGFNFPNSQKVPPFLTLDYILGRGKLNFKETRVLKGGSSDHLAILSKLEI